MQMTIDHDALAPQEGTGLLARLGRRKAWCLLGFVGTAAAVAVAFTAVSPTYRASASLMVASNEAVLRSGTSTAEAQRLGDPADIESQMLLLRSPRLARMILEDPKVGEALVADCEATQRGTWLTALIARALPPPASCEDIATDRKAALQRLASGFSIGPTGRSRVIEVSFVSPVPEAAVLIPNALVDAYLRDDKERKVDTHDNAINWLNDEIQRSGQELRAAELNVENYRSQHGIVRGQMASISSERLSSLSQQLAVAQGAYAQALSRLTKYAGGGDMQEVLSSRTVADLKQQSAQNAGRLAELRRRYGDGHPSVLAAADQGREIDRRLGQESRGIGVSLQRDVQAASARIAELKEQFDTLMRDVGQTGGAEAGIAILVRDVEARREIYVEQLKKVNVLQTERRLLTGDARLVNYAELPDRPWFPKRLPFVMVGAVVASAVGAGLGLLRDRSDNTLRGTTNLPQLAGVPIAGYIPWVRKGRGASWLEQHLGTPSPLQESVRALFGRCMLVPGRSPKTLMVCSSEVGEGKTFLALSMALFAVSTGRRVLVIEADLRRPTFSKALQLPGTAGLSEFLRNGAPLRGKEPLAEIVTSYRGLDIIPAGKPAIDSTELLSNGRLDTLLRVAVANYDLVVMDSPPTLLLMDAQVLARRVDGILYCASYGRSRLDRVLQGVRDLSGAGGRVLGIVVGGGRGGDLPRYDVAGLRSGSYLPVKS